MKKKNSFLTLMFSCCPGGGHMYLGFMKQGVQLMALFFATIAVASFAYILRPISFLIPILLAYSIFDASNKCSTMADPDDSDLDLFKWFNIKNNGKLQDMNYYKIGAYGLIIVGGFILFDTLIINALRNIMGQFLRHLDINLYYIERAIKSSLLGIIFIIGGIKLLGHLKKATPTQQDDDNV